MGLRVLITRRIANELTDVEIRQPASIYFVGPPADSHITRASPTVLAEASCRLMKADVVSAG